MANTNDIRVVGAGTTFLSPTDFIVQVDTSQGAVTLVLPKISTIINTFTTLYQYMGIRFVDASNNASVNNITILGFESNLVNGVSSVVLNTNGVGGLFSIIGDNSWNFEKNIADVSNPIPYVFNYDGYIFPVPIVTITGTTSETIAGVLKIPANTIPIDTIEVLVDSYEFFYTPSGLSLDVKVYTNTTPNLNGTPTLIATNGYNSESNPQLSQFGYGFVKGNAVKENTKIYSPKTSSMPMTYNKFSISDITQDLYIVKSVTLQNAGDSYADMGMKLFPIQCVKA